jgi:hypothetical protein
MDLYRVSIKIRPTKDHPKFWEIQYGVLQICLFGESPDDAAKRAVIITEQLPYEVVSPQGTKLVYIQLACGGSPEALRLENLAREGCLSLFLHACVTGCDEGEFEAMNPLD